jgi:uncharacterized membrane protein YwzB
LVKRGRKGQIITLVIIVVIIVGFTLYAFLGGRSYFNPPQ